MNETIENCPVVFVNESDDVRITWNQSATFSVWVADKEVEAFTKYGIVSNRQAGSKAGAWYRSYGRQLLMDAGML